MSPRPAANRHRRKRPASSGLAVLALLALGLAAAPLQAAPPRVVVSVKPVHSLVAGVMAGLGEPLLLIEGAGSPHGASLRPSRARALSKADLVFWLGPGLERFLVRPLAALARDARVVTLAEAPGIALLPPRGAGPWSAHDHGEAANGAASAGAADPHLWLDPANARAIVTGAIAALSLADPAEAPRYRANGQQMIARIDRLEREIRARLAPLRERPYVVFHDAYQYFERHYGLEPLGAIAPGPETSPGARRIAEMRRRIVDGGPVCVFSEPQFEPALVATLVAGTQARTAVLDPLGAALPAGPEAYFTMMRGLADALAGCLSAFD